MTIICAKDGILCSDGYITFNNGMLENDQFNKIHTPEPGEIWTVMGKRVLAFGLAGTLSVVDPFKELLRKGIYHDTKTFHGIGGASILLYTEDLDLIYIGVTDKHDREESLFLIHEQSGDCSAVGVATAVAKTYMVTGKSARKAVELLVKTNVSLGGKISELNVAEWKKELAEKEAALPKDYVFKPKFQYLAPKVEQQPQQQA